MKTKLYANKMMVNGKQFVFQSNIILNIYKIEAFLKPKYVDFLEVNSLRLLLKQTMKVQRKMLLGTFAVMFALILISFASAELVSDVKVLVNGKIANENTLIVAHPNNVLSNSVSFIGVKDVKDVRVIITLTGNGVSLTEYSERFDIVDKRNYAKFVPLSIPTSFPTGKGYTLSVTTESPSQREIVKFPVQVVQEGASSGGDGTTWHFCENGQVGNLMIHNIDISNTGEDDDDWIVFDTIKVKINIKNVGDFDIDEVFVELGLFDANGVNKASELDFSNRDEEKLEVGDINDGDRDEVNFEFRVPADFEEGTYKLAFKAYSEDQNEIELCADTSEDLSHLTYQEIDIERVEDEDKFIQIYDLEISPESAVCGERITATMGVVNLGDEDQNRVKIVASSPSLNINKEFEIKEGLGIGETSQVSFSFNIPKDADVLNHQIRFKTFYDYKNAVYRTESYDEWITALRVTECNYQNDLEKMVAELENKVKELENKTSALESALDLLKKEFKDFVDRIKRFIKGLPRGLSKNWDKI